MPTAGRTALDSGFAALLREWGEAATYTAVGMSAVALTGLFDNAYEVLRPVPGLEIGTTLPAFQTWTEDVASARRGDLLSHDGTIYQVIRAERDGQGVTVLFLSENQPGEVVIGSSQNAIAVDFILIRIGGSYYRATAAIVEGQPQWSISPTPEA